MRSRVHWHTMIDLFNRRFVVSFVFCGICSLAGCEDVEPNWTLGQTAAQPRPAARPAGRLVQQSTTAPATDTSRSPAVKPAEPPPAPPQLAPGVMNVYQLVLFSGPAPAEAPAGIRHVRLQHARARHLAGVLGKLYVPSGPSGTDDRYTLVFPTPMENELAADAATILDVPAPSGEPPTAPGAPLWAWAMGEACTVLEAPGVDEPRMRRLADQLARVMLSSELSHAQQWMAAMLAGELLAHRLYDFTGADAAYRAAETAARPGGYEQMAAMYGRGRSFAQDGRREQARRCFEAVLGQFSALRSTEIFERTREMLAQWDRRK